MLAQEEARRLRHNFVGTEQLLIGLLQVKEGVAGKVLSQMDVSLKETKIEVEKIIGRGAGFVAIEIPFTPRARRVLEFAWLEAKERFKHNYISTEHLLLGIIRENAGVAIRVLENLKVNIEKIPENITSILAIESDLNTSADQRRIGAIKFDLFKYNELREDQKRVAIALVYDNTKSVDELHDQLMNDSNYRFLKNGWTLDYLKSKVY